MSDYLDRVLADPTTPIAQAVAQDIRSPRRHAHALEVSDDE